MQKDRRVTSQKSAVSAFIRVPSNVLFRGILLAVLLTSTVALATFWLWNARPASSPPAARAAAPPAEGFARVLGPQPLSFPADHGPHPAYQTEWWYYTGNLQAEDGRRFGFQLTFFRRALLPPQDIPPRASDWATGQVYMAHFALSDIDGRGGSQTHPRYHAYERFSRGAAGLSGAQAGPFRVWLDDWQVIEQPPQGTCPAAALPCAYRLSAAQDGILLELDLQDSKGPALQGDRGFSQKGAAPGQASIYYSLSRLAAQGSLQVDGQHYAVSGLAWMDHEYSTSALSPGQVGWDWFSIQLDDGSELMVFQIRRADGSVDPFSSGTLIAADGATTPLKASDFQIEVLGKWKSPRSGAVYPAGWRLRIPAAGLEVEVQPSLADQELNVSYAYWEGAVGVQGTRDGRAVQGNGYVELTGYSRSMGGEF
jgi:predicted secreted hydrolase